MRVNLLRWTLLFVLLCLLRAPLLGQAAPSSTPGPAVASPTAAAYSAEPLVVVRLNGLADMHADGTGFRQRTVAARIQSEASLKQFSVLSIPFAGSAEKVEFHYARVRHPDGTVTETAPADMIEQPEAATREAPFYSDLKDAQLPIKGLRVGDTLEWEVRITRTRAEAPGQFWGEESFLADGVVLEETYELRAPASVHLTTWSNASAGARFERSSAGDVAIYRWSRSRTTPTVGPAAEAQKEADKKRPLTAAEEDDLRFGKLPDLAWTTFPDWQAVGAWYRGLEGERPVPDADVRAKVAEITAGKTTQEDKVRALYAYVSTQIHYIGVAFGIGRYQPHTAGEVLSNQYGDCKDKGTLLAAMLTAIGLQPDIVLIGSQIRFNPAVPAPQSFNHLITHVQVEGKNVWLDSTAEVAPFRMLLATLRDKQALVIPMQGPARLERTPKDLPFAFENRMVATGSLDKDGISESRITLTFRGDDELLLRAVARQITPAQYDELSQRLANGMGYGGTTSHTELGRPEDTAQPFTLSFDYHREKGGDWDNHRIVAQLAPVPLPVVDPKDPPRQALQLGAPRIEESRAEMKLPPGWSAELPEAIHQVSPFATYDLTFHLQGDKLVSERKITVLRDVVPLTELPRYRTFQDAAGLGNEVFIQLNVPGSKSETAGSTAFPETGNTAADALIQQANQALRDRQLEQAQTALKKAEALSNTERGLWNSYGYLEYLRGEPEAAARDYEKELQLHPGQAWTLRTLVNLQVATNKHADALGTIHTWIGSAPDDPEPVISLIRLFLLDNKPQDAVSAGKEAIARLPEDVRKGSALQMQLARAEIRAGDLDEARAILEPLLASTSSPSVINDAAYELANAKFDLPQTEQAEHGAIARLEAETSSWTLDESPAQLTKTVNTLFASWDTMGWILFREGKLAEAESYILAARRNRHSWEISEHLGELRLAQGDKPGALAAFQEADRRFPKADAMGIRRKPGPDQVAVQARIAELSKLVAVPASLPDPSSQDSRTFRLGPSNGRSGTTDYRLLLSRDRIQRAKPVQADSAPDTGTLFSSFKTAAFFPPDSAAYIVRSGFLNCHQDVCDLVLRP